MWSITQYIPFHLIVVLVDVRWNKTLGEDTKELHATMRAKGVIVN